MPRRTVLYDPRKGDSPIQIEEFRFEDVVEPPRTNCFAVDRVTTGRGTFWADAAQYAYRSPTLLFFVPYQHVRFEPDRLTLGERILFHANFLCVETFHAEVGCSGPLFNDPYRPPVVELTPELRTQVGHLFQCLRQEQAEAGLAHQEAMLSHVKVLLILAARQKLLGAESTGRSDIPERHPVLLPLRELIETHYRQLHAPADYAALLHMTPKALGRIVRDQLGQTLTDLIRQRILTHAKWELLHTLRPVKEIAAELGFRDELYFSRLFKKATGQSPTFFREYETEIRNGSNLSMTLSHPPILASGATSDTSGV